MYMLIVFQRNKITAETKKVAQAPIITVPCSIYMCI